jgi:hypothetical protein
MLFEKKLPSDQWVFLEMKGCLKENLFIGLMSLIEKMLL